ncbi:MAG: hypothetical protein U0175_24360 [Caldilineaceae bacterium]
MFSALRLSLRVVMVHEAVMDWKELKNVLQPTFQEIGTLLVGWFPVQQFSEAHEQEFLQLTQREVQVCIP